MPSLCPSFAHSPPACIFGRVKTLLLSAATAPPSPPTATTYTYDANHNRKTMTSAAGTTTYNYDTSNTRLTSKTDPDGKVTSYIYDGSAANGVGNLTSRTYDAAGANQTTSYGYDTTNRLNSVTRSDGTVVAFTNDDWGGLISSTGSFSNGWVNPYRYDGQDRVRYDQETSLYWMSVRAYDPTLAKAIAPATILRR